MKRIDLPKLRSIVLDAIMKKQSVLTLVNRAYDCIGLPVICFDVYFRVVAYAFPRPFYYSHWEDLVASGYAPDDVVVSNDYLSYQHKMYALGKSQIFDWGTSEGYSQACGPIMCEGQLIGYAGIMIEDTDPDDCVVANDVLAQAMSVLLREQRSTGSVEGFSIEQILIKDGISHNQSAYFEQAYPPPYIFAVLSSMDANVSKLQYIKSALCRTENAVVGCLSGEKHLCLLYYGADPADGFSLLKASLEHIAMRHSITGGVSDHFASPLQIPNHRMQAIITLSVGSKYPTAENVFFFRERYCDIVSYCAIEQFGQSACLLPEILTLAEKDEHGSNSYLETLEAYLSNFHRPSSVAAIMGLHKNTILNRMRKIEEILGQSIDEGKNAERLLAGLDIYRMLERDGRSVHLSDYRNR